MNKQWLLILVSFLLLLSTSGCDNIPNSSSQPLAPSSGISEIKDNQNGPINNDTNLVSATVTRVVDGDTVEVDIDGKTEKVRLIGVDTPETVHPAKGEQPYGREASDYTKEQLRDKTVELELDVQERDRYGRLLAYIWVGDRMFNETLLQEGYAQVATYPPNVKYVERFTSAQEEARENNRGLWDITQESSISASEEQRQYVGSIKSDKYHYPDCRFGQQIQAKNQIYFASKAEAEAAGYVPCGWCCEN